MRVWNCEGCGHPNKAAVSLDWAIACEQCGKIVRLTMIPARRSPGLRRSNIRTGRSRS